MSSYFASTSRLVMCVRRAHRLSDRLSGGNGKECGLAPKQATVFSTHDCARMDGLNTRKCAIVRNRRAAARPSFLALWFTGHWAYERTCGGNVYPNYALSPTFSLLARFVQRRGFVRALGLSDLARNGSCGMWCHQSRDMQVTF